MQELIQHTSSLAMTRFEIKTTLTMNIEGDVSSPRAEKVLSHSLAFLNMQSHLLSCERYICSTAVSFAFQQSVCRAQHEEEY